MSFVLPPGDGEVTLSIAVDVAEAGIAAPALSATDVIAAKTLRLTLPPEAIVAMTTCELSKVVRVRKEWPPADEHPDWQRRLEDLAKVTVLSTHLDSRTVANGFARDFGVAAAPLEQVIHELRRRPGG